MADGSRAISLHFIQATVNETMKCSNFTPCPNSKFRVGLIISPNLWGMQCQQTKYIRHNNEESISAKDLMIPID